jgi:hypothetical protein
MTERADMSDAPVQLVSLPVREVMALHKACAAGDVEALNTLADMFPEGSRCFLCDAEVPHRGGRALILLDRRNPRAVMIGVQCAECGALPALVRWRKVTKVLRAMWPGLAPDRSGVEQTGVIFLPCLADAMRRNAGRHKRREQVR